MWVLPSCKDFIVVFHFFEGATTGICEWPDCRGCVCSWDVITIPLGTIDGVEGVRLNRAASDRRTCACYTVIHGFAVNWAHYHEVLATDVHMLWLHLNLVLSWNGVRSVYSDSVATIVVDNLH